MTNTKEHILTISLRHFLEKGYSEVSMSELVSASGLSKGAFYHYFKSKESLYKETINKYFIAYLDSLDMHYKTGKSFSENVRYIYENIVHMMDEIHAIIGSDIHIISYYRTIFDSMTMIQDMKNAVKEYYKMYIGSLRQWIEKGKLNGEVNPKIDSNVLALHIASLIEGTLVVHTFQDSGHHLRQIFEFTFDQLFDFIKPDK